MSRGKKILFLSVLLLVAVLLVEGGLRLALRLGGTPYSAADTRTDLEIAIRSFSELLPTETVAGAGAATAGAVSDDDERETRLHPYWGFERHGERFHDVIAYLGTEPETPELRIVVLGGSVAAGFCNRARKTLAAILEADPRVEGRTVRVLKLVHAGFRQPQQASQLAFVLALGLRPDVVLELDGVNEVALGAANADAGSHPTFPSIFHWSSIASDRGLDVDRVDALLAMRDAERGAVRLGRASLALRLPSSAILGKLSRALVERKRARWVAARESYAASLGGAEGDAIDPALVGPPLPPDADAVAMSVRAWSESSRSMQAMCDERGIPYVHVLQPTLHDPGSKPLTDEEIETGQTADWWREASTRGYPMLREEGRRLRAEHGIVFVDASFVFRDVTETLYYDHCHFERRGNEILAGPVAEGILEALERREHDADGSDAGPEER